jgi:hypothetical protein
MARNKGLTYQRKENKNQIMPHHNTPKEITPPTSKMNFDLGGWVSNAKVLVLVTNLIENPSHKEKLLKSIEGPK